MVEVKNLSKFYGPIQALDSISFQIQKGDVVGFLGPNGAGKSTTMKILTGFMPATSGSVKVQGRDVSLEPLEVKKQIGYLPEIAPLYTDMSVEDYLRFVAQLKQVEKSKISSFVNESIAQTHLQEVRHRKIFGLSKGFKQRVGIAQAIVAKPELIVLDEPSVGLDPKQVAEIRELIRNLSQNRTILLSSHILSEVQSICNKVIIVNRGKIVAQDLIQNLNQKMSSGYLVELITKKSLRSLARDIEKIPLFQSMQFSSDEHLLLEGKDENFMEHLAEFVLSHKLGIKQIREKDMNLEEIFLKLTAEGAKT